MIFIVLEIYTQPWRKKTNRKNKIYELIPVYINQDLIKFYLTHKQN
jgi:hypothetical protein